MPGFSQSFPSFKVSSRLLFRLCELLSKCSERGTNFWSSPCQRSRPPRLITCFLLRLQLLARRCFKRVVETEGVNAGGGLRGFEPQPWRSLALCPWVSYVTPLAIAFLPVRWELCETSAQCLIEFTRVFNNTCSRCFNTLLRSPSV